MSRLVARLTRVDDQLFKPHPAMTRPASRVETPHPGISATTSMTARHERRPAQPTPGQRLRVLEYFQAGWNQPATRKTRQNRGLERLA